MLSGNHLNGMVRRKVILLSAPKPKRERTRPTREQMDARNKKDREARGSYGMTRSEWREWMGFAGRFRIWCLKWNPGMRLSGNAGARNPK